MVTVLDRTINIDHTYYLVVLPLLGAEDSQLFGWCGLHRLMEGFGYPQFKEALCGLVIGG